MTKRILILPKTSSKAVSTEGKKARRSRKWLRADFLLVILVTGFFGLLIFFSESTLVRKDLPSQAEISSVAKQLSSLTQSDLIVFSDGRVWYVRGVQGNNIEIVGWIGDNTKSEEINSFVLASGNFTIVRQNDPKWAEVRDRYIKQ